jgi:Tfp pilus assembly protein PilF
MMLSNAGETRLARWMGPAGVMIGAALGAVAVYTSDRGAERMTSELAPDPALVRYRYATSTPFDVARETGPAIAALEVRAAAMASPFEHAELASLYFRRAQLDGDPEGYAAAEAAARRSLELLPARNAAVLTLAKVASTRHEFRAAIELAQQYKERSAGAQIIVATSLLALGELAGAAQAAHAAIAIEPSTAGYLTRALVMQAQGRDAEAAFDFASAARVEQPGDVTAAARLRALWGRFLVRRGELAGAAQLLDEALRIAPGTALALGCRGELALRAGDARGATRWFEQAFAASRQVRYLIDQARAYELAGVAATADALRGQVEAIVRRELAESGFGHRLDLVEVLVDRGTPAGLAEAVGLARDELARRGSFEVRFQLSRALARSGARDEALREVQAALAAGTREAPLYALAAELERARGNPAAAALYTRQADRLHPGRSAWRTLAGGSAR